MRVAHRRPLRRGGEYGQRRMRRVFELAHEAVFGKTACARPAARTCFRMRSSASAASPNCPPTRGTSAPSAAARSARITPSASNARRTCPCSTPRAAPSAMRAGWSAWSKSARRAGGTSRGVCRAPGAAARPRLPRRRPARLRADDGRRPQEAGLQQSDLLASALSRRSGVAYAPDALVKLRDTRPQKGFPPPNAPRTCTAASACTSAPSAAAGTSSSWTTS